MDGASIAWAEYPDRVVETEQREGSAALVSAASTVVGSAVPAKIDQVLKVVDDAGLTAAAVLASDPTLAGRSHGASDEQLLALLEVHVEAFITTALVDAGLAVRKLDWLGFAPLEDRGGAEVLVSAYVSGAVQSSDSHALVHWLGSMGLQLGEPVFVGGIDPPTPDSYAEAILAPVYIPGLASLGRHDGSLLLLSNGMERTGQKFLDGLAFRPWAEEELTAHFTTPVATLIKQGRVKKTIRLADIVRARLINRRSALACWRCVIETTDQRVVIRGSKPAAPAAAALTAVLGDRLSVRGVRRDPRTGCWQTHDISPLRITSAKLMMGLAALPMLAAAGVATLTFATTAWPATIVHCVTIQDRTGSDTDTNCTAEVQGETLPEMVTLKPAKPFPTGSAVKVHYADWIGLDPFEEQDSWRFVRDLGILAGVVATPALLLAIPWRNRKLRY